MKNIALTVLGLILLASCGSDTDLGGILSDVKKVHAPDRRTEIFDVTMEKSGNRVIIAGELSSAEARDELVRQCEERGLVYEDNTTLLPADNLGETVYAVVNVSVCNFRGEPQHSAEMVTQALLGHPLRMYKKQDYWYYVQSTNDYLGWVDGGALTRMSRKEWDEWRNSERVIYSAEYGHSFAGPDMNSQHVSDLVIHDILKKISSGADWTKVEYPDGRRAFIPSAEVRDFNEWRALAEAEPGSILSTAYRFFGVPYLWGGTSSKGLDCSGFTSTVFLEHGILLPRDASQQVRHGRVITDDVSDLGGLLPGDLLFFGNRGTDARRERVTHVAIYLGDSRFIHESSYVHIQSLNPQHSDFSRYRHDSFLYGKRFLPLRKEDSSLLVKNNPLY